MRLSEDSYPDYYHCPFGDTQSRNTIFQIMGKTGFSAREWLEATLNNFLGEGKDDDTEVKNMGLEEKVKETKRQLETKGEPFVYTAEFIAAERVDEERKKAYQSVTVTSAVPEGEEQELLENPFKFLLLPKNSSEGMVRAAFLRLSKAWHPDTMDSRDQQKITQMFTGRKILDGETTQEEWIEELSKIIDEKPKSAREVEAMGEVERREYLDRQRTRQMQEAKIERIRAEMVTYSMKKMQLISRAYQECKKVLGGEGFESLAGYEWEDICSEKEFLGSSRKEEFKRIMLEGEGEIRKTKDYGASLHYNYGEEYMAGKSYRDSINLKDLFAWMELVQGKELAPTLLDEIVEHYDLDENKAEALRLMIINRETQQFIFETLGIKCDEDGNEAGDKAPKLHWFLSTVYNGPAYCVMTGPRDYESYPSGVELTENGELILKFYNQGDGLFYNLMGGRYDQANFTKTDVMMMTKIAYGLLLKKGRPVKALKA